MQAVHNSQEGFVPRRLLSTVRPLFGSLETKMQFYTGILPQNGSGFLDESPKLYLTPNIVKNTLHIQLIAENPVLHVAQ